MTNYAALCLPETGNAFSTAPRRPAKPAYTPKKTGPRADGPLTPEQTREARNASARAWYHRNESKAATA